jgi:nucleoside-diphosphate-sugar epimerase
MRVLVTGNRGYIGARLVPLLLSEGLEVIGYDNGLFRECAVSPITHVPAIDKDIRDVERADLQNIDAVIHLAGLSNDPLGSFRPTTTLEINFEATVRLARMAKQAGVRRFIFASSCSVYGAAGDQILDEEGSFSPVTPYAISKVQSEIELRKLADKDFTPVFLRAATVYGVSPMIRFDLVLNNLVAWATATGLIFIKSDGTPWRPVVHVEDLARAYLAALRAPHPAVHLQAFNVGSSSENYRISELAELVRNGVPGARIEYAPDGGPDKRCYRVSCSKISRILPDFKPRWTAAMGVSEIYEAMLRWKLAKEDFEGARFSRIDHLKRLEQVGQLDEDLRLVRAPHRSSVGVMAANQPAGIV